MKAPQFTSLEILEKTANEGIQVFIELLKQNICQSFMLFDSRGYVIYSSKNRALDELKIDLVSQKELEFYDEAHQIYMKTVESGEFRLHLLIFEVDFSAQEICRELVKVFCPALFYTCQLLREKERAMRSIEQEFLEILFKAPEKLPAFFDFDSFWLSEKRPYVIQFIELPVNSSEALCQDIIEFLDDYARQNKLPSIRAIVFGNSLIHIIPAQHEYSTFEVEKKWPELHISETFRQLVLENFNLELTIGIGRSYPLQELYRSYEEAQLALAFCRRPDGGGAVQRFADMGIFKYLFFADESVRDTYIKECLTPILTYDRENQADLLHTLRLLLYSGFDWKRTAEFCNVHVNTIYYRVERIEKLLGCSLARAETKFEVFTALKLWDVLTRTGAIENSYVGKIS